MAARRIGAVCGAAALLFVAGACGVEDSSGESVTLRGEQVNGIRLNGIRLNGMRLNGIRLNGTQLGGDAGTTDFIEIKSIKLPSGDGIHSELVGSELFIGSSNGGVQSGAGLAKTRIEFEVQEGANGNKGKVVKFNNFGMLAPGSDVAVYTLELKDSGWGPLCEGNADAILLGDLWDPSTGARVVDAPADALTFACRGAALAKCVEFGYRPWASVDGVSLRDHHQACTRMVRADYCGDGTPHTTDGTAIHVLDLLGIQTDDLSVEHALEAEWGPDGAVCLNPANLRHPGITVGCDIPVCGESFASGGLLQSGVLLSP